MANDKKSAVREYDYLGLVGRLDPEKEQHYILSAVDLLGDELVEEDLREAYKKILRSSGKGSGLEYLLDTFLPKYQKARAETTIKDFCDVYSASEFVRKSLEPYFGQTIESLEKEVKKLRYITSDPDNYFSEEQKKDAKENLGKYQNILSKIILVEDKRFAQLKIKAIDRAEEMMQEQEKQAELPLAA